VVAVDQGSQHQSRVNPTWILSSATHVLPIGRPHTHSLPERPPQRPPERLPQLIPREPEGRRGGQQPEFAHANLDPGAVTAGSFMTRGWSRGGSKTGRVQLPLLPIS
jgi:hypothetical protein